MPASLTIRNTQSPGDILVLAAAVRDLALHHPGKFNVTMSVSPGSEHIFWNSPYVIGAQPARKPTPKGQEFVAHYPLIHKSNQVKKHFLWGFIEYMNEKLRTNVKLTDFRPDLHLSAEEKLHPVIEPPYWLFLSGGKSDFPAKIWARNYWQQVIAATRNDIRWVQCGGGSSNHIMHEKIDGVHEYMVKKTSLRDFIRLIYHADGVVCAVTAAMHIAAALNKPCVVIAGGREPWWWEAYTNENRLINMRYGIPNWQLPVNDTYIEHRYLHTQDQLPCCKGKGCWKSKLSGRGSKCQHIATVGQQQLPKCLAMIKPDHVIDAVLSYHKAGIVGKHIDIIPSAEIPAAGYYLFGSDMKWIDGVIQVVGDKKTVKILPAMNRLESIKTAAKETSGHLFWFEEGSKPVSDYWLRALHLSITPSSVYGRMYRTKDHKYYPHHGCFVAPAKLLNQNAKTYPELFASIPLESFVAVEDLEIPVVRPCIDQEGL